MSRSELARLGSLQTELLARLYLHAAQESALVELAVDVGVPTAVAAAELQPLVAAGLVSCRPTASRHVYRADISHAAAGGLVRALAMTHGPVPVVRGEFAGVAEAELVLLYGGWAGTWEASTGPRPGTSTCSSWARRRPWRSPRRQNGRSSGSTSR